MAARPSEYWRSEIERQAGELAAGTLDPEEYHAAALWSPSLIAGTEAVLAGFERDVRASDLGSDEMVLNLIRRVVLALNEVNDIDEQAGRDGYATSERDDLCRYIDDVLTEAGVDLDALADRQHLPRDELAYGWRNW
jgi:hypothetical protein